MSFHFINYHDNFDKIYLTSLTKDLYLYNLNIDEIYTNHNTFYRSYSNFGKFFYYFYYDVIKINDDMCIMDCDELSLLNDQKNFFINFHNVKNKNIYMTAFINEYSVDSLYYSRIPKRFYNFILISEILYSFNPSHQNYILFYYKNFDCNNEKLKNGYIVQKYKINLSFIHCNLNKLNSFIFNFYRISYLITKENKLFYIHKFLFDPNIIQNNHQLNIHKKDFFYYISNFNSLVNL